MQVGGQMLPKPMQHALPLEVIQFSATARHVFNNYVDNKNATNFEAIKAAGLSSIGALVEQIPVLSTGAHLVQAAGNPYEAKKLEEDMKRRFEPQILRETGIISKDGLDDTKPEWKFLKDKGLSVVPMNKEGIDVSDKDGKKIKVTEDDFKKVSDLRMKLLEQETSKLIKKGAIVWETGKKIPAASLTKEQLTKWLMNKSTKFKKEAINKVFGVQEKKDEKPTIDTRN